MQGHAVWLSVIAVRVQTSRCCSQASSVHVDRHDGSVTTLAKTCKPWKRPAATFQAVAEAGEGRRVPDHGDQAVDGGPQGQPPHRRQVDVDHGPLRRAGVRVCRPRHLRTCRV